MAKPIRPSEVAKAKVKYQNIPDFVIDAFNELIAREYSYGRAIVKQDDAIALILEKAHKIAEYEEVERGDLFNKRWLDVEEIFKKAGWVVEYDKPGYCESYPATFTFSKK